MAVFCCSYDKNWVSLAFYDISKLDFWGGQCPPFTESGGGGASAPPAPPIPPPMQENWQYNAAIIGAFTQSVKSVFHTKFTVDCANTIVMSIILQ